MSSKDGFRFSTFRHPYYILKSLFSYKKVISINPCSLSKAEQTQLFVRGPTQVLIRDPLLLLHHCRSMVFLF